MAMSPVPVRKFLEKLNLKSVEIFFAIPLELVLSIGHLLMWKIF
jgi:hypothetical protein